MQGQVYQEAPIDYALVTHTVMTQLSMKTGMKRWGTHGMDAVSKELEQLHYRDTFELVDPKSLNKIEFNKVLESHLFLKEKEMGI